MFPKIWIFDSYTLMMILGITGAFFIFYLYSKKEKEHRYIIDILIVGCFAIGFGLMGAILFQFFFDLLKQNGTPELSMTFYGGLVFGVIAFIIIYNLYVKKRHSGVNIINDIYIIAPSSITFAHGVGRIGCFLAGCCYGKETDSILGVVFPGMSNPVYPTQLFEAAFLLFLSLILFLIARKKKSVITMPLYLISYSIFRFFIEFLRGDDRGVYIINLSPSQFISIIVLIIGIVLLFTIKNTKQLEMDVNQKGEQLL